MATFVKFDAVLMSKWDSHLMDSSDDMAIFPYANEIYIQPENVTRVQKGNGIYSPNGDLVEITLIDGFSFVVAMSECDVIAKLS